MARSKYIYVVSVDNKIIRAFTVKYEMEGFLDEESANEIDEALTFDKKIEIFRIEDGGDKKVDITNNYFD